MATNTKACIRYKFDNGSSTGNPFANDAARETYYDAVLTRLAALNVDAVHVSIRGDTSDDSTVPINFAAQCSTLGMETWYHVRDADLADDPTDTLNGWDDLYGHANVTRCLVQDEIADLTDDKLTAYNTQYDQIRTTAGYSFTSGAGTGDFYIGSAMVGETMGRGSDLLEAIVGGMNGAEFFYPRFYPVRRHHTMMGLDYFSDKYLLDFESFVKECKRKETSLGIPTVPLLQGFGYRLDGAEAYQRQGASGRYDAFWRLPTEQEMLAMLEMCDGLGPFDYVGIWAWGNPGQSWGQVGAQANTSMLMEDRIDYPYGGIGDNIYEAVAYDGTRPMDGFRLWKGDPPSYKLDAGAGITSGTGTVFEASVKDAPGSRRTKTEIYIDITGLECPTTIGDIIGVNATTDDCHIGQYDVLKHGRIANMRVTCLETPAGGNADIDFYAADEATGSENDAISGLTNSVQLVNNGAWSASMTPVAFTADPGDLQYLYLTAGTITEATYTAGKFLIEIDGY